MKDNMRLSISDSNLAPFSHNTWQTTTDGRQPCQRCATACIKKYTRGSHCVRYFGWMEARL